MTKLPEQSTAPGRISLVMVEDSAFEARLTREAFRRVPTVDIYEFERFASAKLAIQSGPCDYVVLDTTLPDGTGEELFSRLRDAWKGPAVAVTGSTMPEERVAMSKLAHDYGLTLLFKDSESWPKSVVAAMKDAIGITDDSNGPTPTAVALATATNDPPADDTKPPTPTTVWQWVAVKAITMADRVLTKEGILGLLVFVLVIGGFSFVGYEWHVSLSKQSESLSTQNILLTTLAETVSQKNERIDDNHAMLIRSEQRDERVVGATETGNRLLESLVGKFDEANRTMSASVRAREQWQIELLREIAKPSQKP